VKQSSWPSPVPIHREGTASRKYVELISTANDDFENAALGLRLLGGHLLFVGFHGCRFVGELEFGAGWEELDVVG